MYVIKCIKYYMHMYIMTTLVLKCLALVRYLPTVHPSWTSVIFNTRYLRHRGQYNVM